MAAVPIGGAGPVYDALTGRQVNDQTNFTLELKRGETRVFRR